MDLNDMKPRILGAITAGFGLCAACTGEDEDSSNRDVGRVNEATGGSPASATPSETPTPVSPQPSEPAPTSAQPEPATPVPSSGTACDIGVAEEACYDRGHLENMVRFGTGQIPLDPTPSDEEVAAAFLENGCLPKEKVANGCCNPAESEATLRNGQCCYVHCLGVCCGRAFRASGTQLLATVVDGVEWRDELDCDATPCPSAGVEWLRDAQFEHASVASFSSFAMTLLGLGAPAELVRAAIRAGQDEVEHARACFALASHHLGTNVAPGPLETNGFRVTTDLEAAIMETFVDGCIGETIAALTASAQLEATQNESTRRVLSRIVRDECRHAELAWRFVAWGTRRLGPRILVRLRAALASAETSFVDETPHCDDLTAWHEAGRLSLDERRRIASDAFRGVLRQALSALDEGLARSEPQRLAQSSSISKR